MSAVEQVGGWAALLHKISAGSDLSLEESRAAMRTVLQGEATSAQIAALVMGMRTKGESAVELEGMLSEVRSASSRVDLPTSIAAKAIDIVGTGGDKSHSVNISTMAAFVVAGAGVPVCKHGNRAASSQCGTADVLEALGVRIDLEPVDVARCVQEAGMGFCFAQKFHPAFRHAGPTRKELGVPTVFNLLGPMANPANVSFMVVGVGDPRVAEKMARAIASRGIERAWIVHGHGGLDELSLSGPCSVVEIRNNVLSEFTVNAGDLGLQVADVTAVRGGDPSHNAQIVLDTFNGQPGPVRDIVVLNAAAGLTVAGACDSLAQGVALAQASIDNGSAMHVVEALKISSNAVAR